jgi:DNA-binding transcriptional regulator LsrR (DeoR family)
MVMYAKIRRMFYREHLSISEIQRRTTLSRNTVKPRAKLSRLEVETASDSFHLGM